MSTRRVVLTEENIKLLLEKNPDCFKNFKINEQAIDDSIEAALPQFVEWGILDPSDLPSSSGSKDLDKVAASLRKYNK